MAQNLQQNSLLPSPAEMRNGGATAQVKKKKNDK